MGSVTIIKNGKVKKVSEKTFNLLTRLNQFVDFGFGIKADWDNYYDIYKEFVLDNVEYIEFNGYSFQGPFSFTVNNPNTKLKFVNCKFNIIHSDFGEVADLYINGGCVELENSILMEDYFPSKISGRNLKEFSMIDAAKTDTNLGDELNIEAGKIKIFTPIKYSRVRLKAKKDLSLSAASWEDSKYIYLEANNLKIHNSELGANRVELKYQKLDIQDVLMSSSEGIYCNNVLMRDPNNKSTILIDDDFYSLRKDAIYRFISVLKGCKNKIEAINEEEKRKIYKLIEEDKNVEERDFQEKIIALNKKERSICHEIDQKKIKNISKVKRKTK